MGFFAIIVHKLSLRHHFSVVCFPIAMCIAQCLPTLLYKDFKGCIFDYHFNNQLPSIFIKNHDPISFYPNTSSFIFIFCTELYRTSRINCTVQFRTSQYFLLSFLKNNCIRYFQLIQCIYLILLIIKSIC